MMPAKWRQFFSWAGLTEELQPRYRWPVIVILACSFVASLGFSYSQVLLSVLIEHRGAGTFFLTINSMMSSISGILSAFLLPPIFQQVGLRKSLIGVSVITSCAFPIAYLAADTIELWHVARFIIGIGGAGIFMVIQIWLNQIAPDSYRGSLLGLMGTISAIGYTTGPLLIGAVGAEKTLGFSMCLVLFWLCALLATGMRDAANRNEQAESVAGPAFINRDFLYIGILGSVLVTAGLLYGWLDGATGNLGPVYGMRHNLTDGEAAVVYSMINLGAVVFQVILGRGIDVFGSRAVMIVCAGTSAASLAGSLLIEQTLVAIYGLFFLLGAMINGLWIAAIAKIGARYCDAELERATAGLFFYYNLAQITMLPLLGLAIDHFGLLTLPISMAVMLGAFAVLLLFVSLDAGMRTRSVPQ